MTKQKNGLKITKQKLSIQQKVAQQLASDCRCCNIPVNHNQGSHTFICQCGTMVADWNTINPVCRCQPWYVVNLEKSARRHFYGLD